MDLNKINYLGFTRFIIFNEDEAYCILQNKSNLLPIIDILKTKDLKLDIDDGIVLNNELINYLYTNLRQYKYDKLNYDF